MGGIGFGVGGGWRWLWVNWSVQNSIMSSVNGTHPIVAAAAAVLRDSL